MNLKFLGMRFAAGAVAVFATVSVAALALSATPADAAKRKYYRNASPNAVVRTGPRTRVYITRRSWLDAGVEVAPGERKFSDYALPPGYSFADQMSPRGGFSRQPLAGPFDLPGNPGYN